MALRLLTTAVLVSSSALGIASSRSDDNSDTPLPLVIWHGLGDTFNSEGIQWIGETAEAIHPGTFVYSISVAGDDASADRSGTFFGNVSSQVATVCDVLASHPILSTAPGIDAIGFSQGGQFLRGYIERCNNPPVRSLVTFGSQHNGISQFRECASSDWLCKGAMALLRFNTWSSFVQSRLVPAQYYRDPAEYQAYLDGSTYLADINNEREIKNQQYKKNLASLTKFVMFLFEDDTLVHPRESAWFGEVTAEDEKIPLREREMYNEDWLGLRELDEKGGIVFRSITAEHMQIPEQVLNDTMREFFGPYGRKFESHRYEEPVNYGGFYPDEL
jgi:palmitoyl-protein thioesterase